MNGAPSGSTALIGGQEIRQHLAARLPAQSVVASCDELAAILRDDVLWPLSVLVLDARSVPHRWSLAVLAWINLEYPHIQKVAVVEGSLPLPIARFLTSCGVELVWAKPNGSLEHIVSVVDRMQGNSGWIAPWAVPVPSVRAEPEVEYERAQ